MAQQQLFILKVALSHAKRTWRRIEILGDQSLDQLHETILDIFPEKNYPIITVSNGESPQQYPEYDDDGGEEY